MSVRSQAGLLPLLEQGTAIVFAQNGIPGGTISACRRSIPPFPISASSTPAGACARAIPKERIIGGVIFSSNEVIAPGVVANLSPDRNRLLIGECDDRRSERIARLRAVLNDAAIESPEVTQIRETIWSKLLHQHVDVGALPVDRADRARRPRRS